MENRTPQWIRVNWSRQEELLLRNPPEPKPESEPGVHPARKPGVKNKIVRPSSPSVEVTGKRSCTLKKCAFNSCPNHNPSSNQNDGVTYFPFPKTPVAAWKWSRVVSRRNNAPCPLRMGIFVCSQHFAPWLISADGQGMPRLDREAVPNAEPFKQEDLQNIEKVLLPNAELNEDSIMKVEVEDADDEVRRAVNSLAHIFPPENGLKLQSINLDNNENATLHYLSVDKNYTVNHTRVDIHKNNMATLHYVDTNNKVNRTLRCIDLNGDNINSYEDLIDPNITNTQQIRNIQTEIAPNVQSNAEQSDNFRINSNEGEPVSNSGEHDTRDKQLDEDTIQSTLTDNLHSHIIMKSVDIKIEIDDPTDETDNFTSQIQPSDDEDDDENQYIVKLEYESDSDS